MILQLVDYWSSLGKCWAKTQMVHCPRLTQPIPESREGIWIDGRPFNYLHSGYFERCINIDVHLFTALMQFKLMIASTHVIYEQEGMCVSYCVMIILTCL